MPVYAVYENNVVINVIVAESKKIAEEVTGYSVIETEGTPWIDWELHEDGIWRSRQPFPSWQWNGEAWDAPVARPTDSNQYVWDEESLSWIQTENEV